MEYRQNLGTESPAIRNEMLEHSLGEHYRSLVRWDGPKHPAFNTYNARLLSFDKAWPHQNVEVFSAAAFFYTGLNLTIAPKLYSFYTTSVYNYLSSYYRPG
jgi:hypothetical protein